MTQDQLIHRYDAVMMNAFGAPKRVFARGEGVHVWDADGNRYLVLENGIYLFSLLLVEEMALLVEAGILLDIFTPMREDFV